MLKCWYECGKSCLIYWKIEWKFVNFWIMYNLIVIIYEFVVRKMLEFIKFILLNGLMFNYEF